MIKTIRTIITKLLPNSVFKQEDFSDVNVPKKSSNMITFDYKNIPDPVMSGNPLSNKTLLLMDDQDSVFYLFECDFDDILADYGYDVRSNFKIAECSGPNAGFIADKYLSNCRDELVIAVLDITLGTLVKTPTGSKIFDGVDIAVKVMEQQPECIVKFCTAHMLSKENDTMREYADKFREHTGGKEISDYYFSKNSDRANYIYNIIKEHELQ